MRGYFGIGIYHPKKEVNIGTLWRTAHCFGANFIYTIGRRYKRQSGDTTKAGNSIPLFEYSDFEEFYEHLPYNCMLVGVETANVVPLNQFVHPERTVYMLGSEDHSIPQEILNKCHRVVYLPGKFCLNVAVAGSIVLFDRLNKANVTNYNFNLKS